MATGGREELYLILTGQYVSFQSLDPSRGGQVKLNSDDL